MKRFIILLLSLFIFPATISAEQAEPTGSILPITQIKSVSPEPVIDPPICVIADENGDPVVVPCVDFEIPAAPAENSSVSIRPWAGACDCEPLDSYYCQLYPEACATCWEECPGGPGSDPRRGLRLGRQLGVNYTLKRNVGAFSIDYGPHDLEMTEVMRRDDLTTVNLWTDSVPYCAGHHAEPWLWVTDDPGCAAEQFWRQTPAKQIFIRFHAWTETDGEACRINTHEPIGFLVYRLYEMIWYRDITIIITPWEQGWYALGCYACDEDESCCPESGNGANCSWGQKQQDYLVRQDRLIAQFERRQIHVEQARKLMLQRYPGAKLNVLTAMVVNKSGGYRVPEGAKELTTEGLKTVRDIWWIEDLPTLADRIRLMDHPPDLLGISYYLYGIPPEVAIDSIAAESGYPPSRMFIAEFGGRDPAEQVERFNEYVPAFWRAGIRTILGWIYYMPVGCYGCAPEKWILAEETLDAIRALNIQAITWRDDE